MEDKKIENQEFIPGTNIPRPRNRGEEDPYETDEQYVEYLRDYYNNYFPNVNDENNNSIIEPEKNHFSENKDVNPNQNSQDSEINEKFIQAINVLIELGATKEDLIKNIELYSKKYNITVDSAKRIIDNLPLDNSKKEITEETNESIEEMENIQKKLEDYADEIVEEKTKEDSKLAENTSEHKEDIDLKSNEPNSDKVQEFISYIKVLIELGFDKNAIISIVEQSYDTYQLNIDYCKEIINDLVTSFGSDESIHIDARNDEDNEESLILNKQDNQQDDMFNFSFDLQGKESPDVNQETKEEEIDSFQPSNNNLNKKIINNGFITKVTNFFMSIMPRFTDSFTGMEDIGEEENVKKH